MIDHCPFKAKDIKTIDAFAKSKLLHRIAEKVDYDTVTGVQFTKSISYKFYNLNFHIYFKSKGVYSHLICRGSFHYLMNAGKHNANNFNFVSLKNFLLDFQEAFKIDLKNLILMPPEIGINIRIPFDVPKVIDHLICETRKEFHFNPPGCMTSKISGHSKSESRLKIYSKYHDCPNYCDNNTLRLEKKFKRVRGLHNFEIYSMADLLDETNWLLIAENHIQAMEQIALFDYNVKAPNKEWIKNKIIKYNNPRFWSKLIKDCREDKKYYDAYNKKIKDLNNLSKKYGSNMKSKILDIARSHWDWFFQDSKITMYASIYYTMYAVDKCREVDRDIIRICPITREDISMQKGDSFLLSNTELKHLEK